MIKMNWGEIVDLLKIANLQGIKLFLKDNNLSYQVEKNAKIDPALMELLRRNKVMIIEFIRSELMASTNEKEIARESNELTLLPDQEVYDIFHNQKKEYLRYLILGECVFNMPFWLAFENLDKSALEKAWQATLNRHESLRTTFIRTKDGLKQRILKKTNEKYQFELIDAEQEVDKIKLFEKIVQEYQQLKFNFEEGPLLKSCLIKFSKNTHYMLVVLHHVIGDATSINVLKEEIYSLYLEYKDGNVNEHSPSAIQYKEYAHWVNEYLASDKGKIAKDFYRKTIMESILKEYPAIFERRNNIQNRTYFNILTEELKKALAKEDIGAYSEAFGSVVNLFPDKGSSYVTYITPDLFNRWKKISIELQETLFILLTCVFLVNWVRRTNQPHIRICIPFSTRKRKEFEKIVGWLMAEILVPLDIDQHLCCSQLANVMSNTILDTSEHCFYPIERILSDLDLPLDILAPLFINYIKEPSQRTEDFTNRHTNSGPAHFKLDFVMVEQANCVRLTIKYNNSYYQGNDIQEMMNGYIDLLSKVSTNLYDPLFNI